MTLDEILQDIHALEADLETYERKYGVLSETFYESYLSGEEPPDETPISDWTRWASAYKIWLRRHEQYRTALSTLSARFPSLSMMIQRDVRYEPLSIPA
jgi:hypothetical protein